MCQILRENNYNQLQVYYPSKEKRAIGLSTEVDNHSTQVINTVDTSHKFKYVLDNSCCGLRHSDSRFILKNLKKSVYQERLNNYCTQKSYIYISKTYCTLHKTFHNSFEFLNLEWMLT